MSRSVTEPSEDRQLKQDIHPLSSFAITMPLPARAEKTKPALTIVKMAKPLAFSRMLRGMTPSSPLFPLSTKDLTGAVRYRQGGWHARRTYPGGLFTFFGKRLGERIGELHELHGGCEVTARDRHAPGTRRAIKRLVGSKSGLRSIATSESIVSRADPPCIK